MSTALLERLCVATSVNRVAAETGIPRTTLRRVRATGRLPSRPEGRAADITARLRAFAARSGLAPAEAGTQPGPPAPASMVAKVEEAKALQTVADARAAQLRVSAEARRQLKEDRVLIPTSEFVGIAVSVATELRQMADRQRRRVEAIAPAAGAAVEEEWLATAPRIERLLRRIEPAGA